MSRESDEYRYFIEQERKEAFLDACVEDCKKCKKCARGVLDDRFYCLDMPETPIDDGIVEFDYSFHDFCPKLGVRRYGV